MEGILATALALVLALALPPAIIAAKKALKGNPRMAGIALSIGMAFAFLHDPRKNETIENIGNQQKEEGPEA